MATQTKLQIIDADSHVLETEHTWDYMEPSEEKYRPQLLYSPNDPTRQYWVIDGKIRGLRFPTLTEQQLRDKSLQSGRNVETPQAAREVDDVSLRLKHMDDLGVDVQVLHNTLFIEPVAQKPDVDAAICRSWNRWLAGVWAGGQGRLRWSCVLPTLMLDEAVVQMRFAKEHGAVAVCVRPVEGDRSMLDPYFYPIYEEASRLNMAIAVHVANGNSANLDMLKSFPGEGGFYTFRVPIVASCFMLLMSELPQVFPNLRWGFIEASAQWLPWVYHEAARRSASQGKKFPEDPFTEFKVFVTCQSDDDLPYILKYSGENCLLIGTDYGHTDTSSELDAILTLQGQTDISQKTKDMILHHNPKALYSI